jgi:hypothetical protein
MSIQQLSRSGKRPIVFHGEQIGSSTTKGMNSTRWTNVEVYRTQSGKYIVGIADITCWQGERDSFSAEVFGTIDEAVSHIEETVPSLAEEIAEELGVSEVIN